MRRLVTTSRKARTAAGLATSLLLVGTVMVLGASPALAAPPPLTMTIPVPGLSGTCTSVSGTQTANSGPTTISGVALSGISGECTASQAHAAVNLATFGANTIASATSMCTVGGVPTSVATYMGSPITVTQTIVTPDGYTLNFNVPVSMGGLQGRIAVQIVKGSSVVNVAETLCSGAFYPIVVAPIQQSSVNSASLGTPTRVGAASNLVAGRSVSSLLVLLLAVGGLILVNIMTVRTFRRRDHA